MHPTASAASTPPQTDDEGGRSNNGYIKESTVTKMTPQGTRETTIKKTAPDVSRSSTLHVMVALRSFSLHPLCLLLVPCSPLFRAVQAFPPD